MVEALCHMEVLLGCDSHRADTLQEHMKIAEVGLVRTDVLCGEYRIERDAKTRIGSGETRVVNVGENHEFALAL